MVFVYVRYAIYTREICYQTYYTTAEDQMIADNAVRLMDAFINKFDVKKWEFIGTVHKSEWQIPISGK